MIAMALSCQPDLLIADEPTTALDVTIQAQIVDLLMSICEEENTAVVFITHDLAILAGFAERVLVMYSGRIVEEGPVDTIYYGATHPYTWGLMTSIRDSTRAAKIASQPFQVIPPQRCSNHRAVPFTLDVGMQRRSAPERYPLSSCIRRTTILLHVTLQERSFRRRA